MEQPTHIKEYENIHKDDKNKLKRKFDFDSEEIFNILMIILVIIFICFYFFKLINEEPEQPIPNKYNLVEFTTDENEKSYTDVITMESNDKYIKYIFIDENNNIQIDKIEDNYRTNIKLIETTNKPFVEMETIEKKELFIFDTSEITYKLYLPKEDIETLKNEW